MSSSSDYEMPSSRHEMPSSWRKLPRDWREKPEQLTLRQIFHQLPLAQAVYPQFSEGGLTKIDTESENFYRAAAQSFRAAFESLPLYLRVSVIEYI